MKKFLKDMLFFSIPIVVALAFFGIFVRIGYESGEFLSIESIQEEIHQNKNVLLGLGYNEQTIYLKYLEVNERKPEVVALGTSRAMMFVEDYFSVSFYNLGGVVSGNYSEYKSFLDNIEYDPIIILLDLDAWVFNDAWNQRVSDFTGVERRIYPIERGIPSMTVSIVKDFLDHKWNFSDLNNFPNGIGFNGRIKGNGFRYDGSYYYGNIYRHPELDKDYQFQNTLKLIDEEDMRFEYGEHIDDDTLRQLEDLLGTAHDRNIYVIGYLAPFAPTVYQKMMDTGEYGYISEITPACKELFEKYGYEYYDFADGKSLGIDDAYFVDGIHGSEVAYGYMVKQMYRDSENLSKVVDDTKLEEMLQNAYNGLVFDAPY